MKRAEKIWDNIHIYQISEECERINEKISKLADYHCKAVINMLEREEDWTLLTLYDPDFNHFI